MVCPLRGSLWTRDAIRKIHDHDFNYGQKWHSCISRLRTLAEQYPLTVPSIFEGREWMPSRRDISFYLLFSRNLILHNFFILMLFSSIFFFLFVKIISCQIRHAGNWKQNYLYVLKCVANPPEEMRSSSVQFIFTQDVYVHRGHVGNELAIVNVSEALANDCRATRESARVLLKASYCQRKWKIRKRNWKI